MAINVTLGTPDYRYNGVIAVPVTFSEAVVAPSKTIFPLSRVSGDALADVTYDLVGENAAYRLIIEIPLNRKGSFRISGNGMVIKGSVETASETFDQIMLTPLTIPYDTTVPELVDHRVVRVRAADRSFPDDQTNTPSGDRIDAILRYNTRCTLNDPVTEFGSGDATFADFLDYGGSNLPPPNFYRKTDTAFPTDLPLGEVLGSDWSSDGLTADENEATIYLIRWNDVPVGYDLSVDLKAGFVRGPVR